jgi:hypothetical protein
LNTVLYFRSRPSAGAADQQARRQQIRAARCYSAEGGLIRGSFLEVESAPLGYGHQETAVALRAAIRCVQEVLTAERFCNLAILRVDAIGNGDGFDAYHPYFIQLIPYKHRVGVLKTGWSAMDRLTQMEWEQSQRPRMRSDPSIA